MKSKVGGLVLLVTGATACGSPPVAKSNPTWEADVYPILQGQCLHCHGETAKENGANHRFDFFDLDSNCKDVLSSNPTSGKSKAGLIAVDVEGQDGERAKMPPGPATLLEDWQRDTLVNWAKKKASGSRGMDNKDNHKPKIIITSKLPNDVGDELKVSYRFEDTDGDPVIGVLKLGDAKVDLLKYSGEVTIKGITGSSGDNLTLSAHLCDGWDDVPQDNLGEIKRQ